MRAPLWRGLALAGLWGASLGSQAQALPSAASVLRQQESAMPQRAPQPTAGAAVELGQRPAAAPAGGPSVRIQRIRFTGDAALAEEAGLAALVQPSIGQSLSAAQLLELAERVARHLKAQGWILAQAVLPPQDVTEGDIEIRLIPGSLEGGREGIVIAGQPQRVEPQRIRDLVAAAMPDLDQGRFKAPQLEEGLLRAGELAGISATASLERGAQPGTSRLTVQAQEAPLASGSLTLDNFGSPYTGVHRATGVLTLNSPFRQGDALMLNLVGSQGVRLLASQWALPVGDAGVKLGGSFTALRYQVGGELADLGLSGRAQMVGLNASYPLVLSQAIKLRARLGLDHKAYVDTLSGDTIGDKRAQVLSAGFSGQAVDGRLGGGISDWSLALDVGRVDLSRLTEVLDEDQDGARTHGAYHKLSYSFVRLQPLPSKWLLQFSFNGQVAARNLDASEKFSLGGNSAIRAYPGGEGSGDQGWVASTTLRREIGWPFSSHKVELSGFVDWGRIQVHKTPWTAIDSATGRNSYRLAGTGLGLSVAQTGAWRTSLVWAHGLGSNPGRSIQGANSDGKAARSRVLLSIHAEV